VNIGDLIQVREDIPFGPSLGDIGIVEFTEMQRVCVKSGILGLAPEDGGPVYDYERCIVAMFSDKAHRVSTYYDRYDIIAEAS
jgi:hypothetical protein